MSSFLEDLAVCSTFNPGQNKQYPRTNRTGSLRFRRHKSPKYLYFSVSVLHKELWFFCLCESDDVPHLLKDGPQEGRILDETPMAKSTFPSVPTAFPTLSLSLKHRSQNSTWLGETLSWRSSRIYSNLLQKETLPEKVSFSRPAERSVDSSAPFWDAWTMSLQPPSKATRFAPNMPSHCHVFRGTDGVRLVFLVPVCVLLCAFKWELLVYTLLHPS